MRRRTVVAFSFFVARAFLRQMRANSIRSVLEGMGHPHSTNVHRDACMMPFASREDCDAGHRVAAEPDFFGSLQAWRRRRDLRVQALEGGNVLLHLRVSMRCSRAS